MMTVWLIEPVELIVALALIPVVYLVLKFLDERR